MAKYAIRFLVVLALYITPVSAQQASLEAEVRQELADLKTRIVHLESLLEQLHAQNSASLAKVPNLRKGEPHERKSAPALNTPGMLPTMPEAYRKSPPRFDVLIQTRGDYYVDDSRNSSFILRKAELGVKGQINSKVDFSIELDPVRSNDPFRRTYFRLRYIPRLHVKIGLEKAPIGLEELTSTAQIPFVDRSEVNDRFAAAEELGIHFESHWPHWLLQLSVSNGGRRLLRDDNRHKDITARIVWGPISWLSLGGATLQGEVGSERRQRDRYNVEFKLGSNISGGQSEFYRAKDGNVWSSAFYIAAYRAFPVGVSWMTHLQPVVRYEHIDRNDNGELDELRLLTVGLSLILSEHHSKLQLNYLKDLHTGTRRDEVRAQYQVEF